MKITEISVDRFSNTIKSPLGGKVVNDNHKLIPKISKLIEPESAKGFDFNNNLDEAKNIIKSSMVHGMNCPCCGQRVKLYKRSINATMAKALFIFYTKTVGSNEFFHLSDIFKGEEDPTIYRGDFAKLRFWGLVEGYVSDKSKSRVSMGKWRITQLGSNFVLGRIKVSKYAFVYNNILKNLGTDMISFTDIIQIPVDYSIQGLVKKDGMCVG